MRRVCPRPGQPRGFDCVFAGVLAAERRAKVRNDDSHPVFGQMERARQLAAHSEWILRAGPDGEPSIVPLRDGCPRLQRRVLNVGDVISAA